ncbi:MAG: hypothetical protein ABH864_02750 [archaeon]
MKKFAGLTERKGVVVLGHAICPVARIQRDVEVLLPNHEVSVTRHLGEFEDVFYGLLRQGVVGVGEALTLSRMGRRRSKRSLPRAVVSNGFLKSYDANGAGYTEPCGDIRLLCNVYGVPIVAYDPALDDLDGDQRALIRNDLQRVLGL